MDQIIPQMRVEMQQEWCSQDTRRARRASGGSKHRGETGRKDAEDRSGENAEP